jgi:hypothetical protein
MRSLPFLFYTSFYPPFSSSLSFGFPENFRKIKNNFALISKNADKYKKQKNGISPSHFTVPPIPIYLKFSPKFDDIYIERTSACIPGMEFIPAKYLLLISIPEEEKNERLF